MATRPRPPVGPPEPLDSRHDLSQFSNGKHASLDQWLREQAVIGEGLSARTYVITTAESSRVIGYYTISAASAQRGALPSAKLRRNMPDPIPLLLIGRFAIDRSFQGQGLGADLLVDAIRRCLAAAEIVGARGLLAHAIDEEAVRFYEKYGFVQSPLGERVMVLPLETARALLAN